MKKFATILTLAAICVLALAFTGCFGGNQDEDLVGTWGWDLGPAFVYIFNEDGTGSRGIVGIETEEFEWSTSGSQLRINRTGTVASGEIRNERWDYTIENNVLTIESRQESDLVLRYIRQ